VQPEGQRKSRLPFPVNLIFNVKSFYFVFIIVMIASMASVGLATQGSTKPDPPPIIDITATPQATSQAKVFASPAPVIDGTKPYNATFKTNKGDIVVELATDTPETVNSLAFLAAKNFYDNQAFFYLDHNYWAQVGDPACNPELDQTCTGTGDAGYKVALENGEGSEFAETVNPLHGKHLKLSLVAPSLQGSEDLVASGQFRILFADDARLDGTETVFGMVIEGQSILENAATLHLCTALTQQESGCAEDFTDAIIIEDVVVAPSPLVPQAGSGLGP
jgi:cyclophilin family peptidyl-prolyl cis-trans isomerase